MITFSEETINEFLIFLGGEINNGKIRSRDEEKIRTKTLKYYEQRLKKFLEITGGELTTDTIYSFVIFAQSKECPYKYLDPARRFLEWLSNVRGLDLLDLIQLLKEARKTQRKKAKKTYAEKDSVFDVTITDVHEHILRIYRSRIRLVPKLRAILASALAASTGLRPEELTKLSRGDIDLSNDYFILPATKSKTHTERVIPLHPQVKDLFKFYIKLNNDNILFSYGSIRNVFDKAGTLRLKHFRKFFAIHSARIGFPDPYRVAIMGHDTELLEKLLGARFLEITEEFYRKFTPEAIVEMYMNFWGKVEILPEGIDAKAILKG